jgi:hypothetical protein
MGMLIVSDTYVIVTPEEGVTLNRDSSAPGVSE